MNSILSNSKSSERKDIEPEDLTLENITTALAHDNKVKLAGIDIDGQSGPNSLQPFVDSS